MNQAYVKWFKTKLRDYGSVVKSAYPEANDIIERKMKVLMIQTSKM